MLSQKIFLCIRRA